MLRSHLETLLASFDGSNVSSDTTTDDNDIVFTFTERIPFVSCRSFGSPGYFCNRARRGRKGRNLPDSEA